MGSDSILLASVFPSENPGLRYLQFQDHGEHRILLLQVQFGIVEALSNHQLLLVGILLIATIALSLFYNEHLSTLYLLGQSEDTSLKGCKS